jgi:3-deoxy-D-manno-octulosonate 8-phosphate phosphatase (KDO 8-P phosphatase)
MDLTKLSKDVIERAKKVKIVIFDVDGVLTDGGMIYCEHGDEIRNFDVTDGLGIHLLAKAGIKSVILTASTMSLIKRRAKVLKIAKFYDGCLHKLPAYEKIKKQFKVKDEEVCFVGDDIIDICVLKRVGFAAAPKTAVEDIKPFIHYITERSGGKGAVREICDLILQTQNKWDDVTKKFYG